MTQALPLLLLTRPNAGSQAFWHSLPDALRARMDLIVAPLIRPVVTGPLPDLATFDGLIATSAQAIEALQVLHDGPLPALPCYCVGDATAFAAQKAGLISISAAGDAQALIANVSQRAQGQRLLHIRGTHTRGNVADRLSAQGVPTDTVLLYDQVAQPLGDAAQKAADSAPVIFVPLFSPRTAALFAAEYIVRTPLYLASMSVAVDFETRALIVQARRIAPQPDAAGMVQAVLGLATDAGLLEG